MLCGGAHTTRGLLIWQKMMGWVHADPPIRRFFTGAEDGIRTRDPLLGKEVLYH